MDTALVRPWAGLRVKSALITALVALTAAVFASIAVMAVLLFSGLAHSESGGGGSIGGFSLGHLPVGGSGPIPDTSNPAMLHMETWASLLAFSLVGLVAVLVASRMGRGAVGDAVFHINAVDASGAPVGRWRNLANAALPVLVWFAAAVPTNARVALLVVAVVWLPAVVRADRRSPYSLLTGTHYSVEPALVRRKGPKQPPVLVDGQWTSEPK